MIITFYSFKGGVGRSMALANVANWLRLQRLRVAIVDWDLEAPGIECFFLQDEIRREAVRRAPGLLDLLISYKLKHAQLPIEFFHSDAQVESMSNSACAPSATSLFDGRVAILGNALPSLDTLVVQLAPQNQKDEACGGPIYLLPPGVRDSVNRSAYARDVQGFDWNEFYAQFDGDVFFGWLRRELERHFDVTLIDSRTGITEVGGICTREMADVVVSLCAPNSQNLDGSALFIRSLFTTELRAARHGRPLRVVHVPTRYDNGESDRLREFQEKFIATTRELQALEPDGGSPGLDPRVVWDLRIAYTPKYAYTERLCVGAPDAITDLEAQYVRIARFLAKSYLDSLDAEQSTRKSFSVAELTKLVSPTLTVTPSLDSMLESAYGELSAEAKALAPVLLRRLVGFADPTDRRSTVLLRRSINDFLAEHRGAIEQLVRVRLLSYEVDDEPSSNLGHTGPAIAAPDALVPREFVRIPYPTALAEWGRLRDWVQQCHEFLQWRAQLQIEMADSERRKNQPLDANPDGAVTTTARELVKQADSYAAYLTAELNRAEQAFLEWVRSASEPHPVAALASPASVDASVTRAGVTMRTAMYVLGAVVLVVALVAVFVSKRATAPLPHPSSPSPVAASVTPQSHEVNELLTLAKNQEQAGDDATAAKTYSEVLDKGAVQAASLRAFAGLGAIRYRQKQYEPAVTNLSKAIQLGATDAELFYLRGQAYYNLDKIPEAIADFQKSLSLAPNNQKALYALGTAYQSKRDYPAAIDAYGQALNVNPNFLSARYSLAIALLDQGKAKESIDSLTLVANAVDQVSPDDVTTRELARERLKKLAISVNPGGPSSPEKRIYVQYANPRDTKDIKDLVAALQGIQPGVMGAEVAPPNTEGDVRYFFSSDREFAQSVKRDVERLLKEKLGISCVLQLLALDGRAFPKARRGTIEVWLAALDTLRRPPAALVAPKRPTSPAVGSYPSEKSQMSKMQGKSAD